ncbi:unnamed protein product [Moneuplotes crassus]|uniref:Uncharacterized protein n=1 Tax=Euplotes crassus TaxID=5936 RepID=A0AAD1X482_EUPCR|nr:unnamed protein product [Moneuplotes crassus]
MNSSHKILTNINYISHIIKYYGYLQECANLFRRLCKKSQSEWDQNQKAIINVIMNTPEARMVINLGHEINPHVLEFLINGDKFNYYAIECSLAEKKTFKIFISFLEMVSERNKELGICNPKLFTKVMIGCKKSLSIHLKFVKNCIKMENHWTLSKLFKTTKLKNSSDCVYIDIIKCWPSTFVDLYPRCGILEFDVCCEEINPVLQKHFEILQIHPESLSKVSEVMTQLGSQNVHCKSISFDSSMAPLTQRLNREMLDFNKGILAQNLEDVLKYFPKVTTIRIKQRYNSQDLDAFQIMIQSKDNSTSRLANINSLYFNTCQDKNEKVLHINKSKVEFIIKIHSDTSGYDEFYVLQANSFEYYCQSYVSFDQVDDILILKRSSHNFYQFKIKNYKLLYTEKEALQHERYSEYIKKLSELKDLKVADICLIGVTERVFKSTAMQMIVSNKLSNHRPHYFIEAYKCTSYSLYDCVKYDKVAPLLESLKGQLVSVYFLKEFSGHEIFRDINLDKPEPESDQESSKSQGNEDNESSNSKQKDEDSESSEFYFDMCSKCKKNNGYGKFIEFLDKLEDCHTLEFRSEALHNDRKDCKERLLQFLKNNTKLRDLEIATPNKDFSIQVLDSLTNNYSLRTCILEDYGYGESEKKDEYDKKVKEFSKDRFDLELSSKTSSFYTNYPDTI